MNLYAHCLAALASVRTYREAGLLDRWAAYSASSSLFQVILDAAVSIEDAPTADAASHALTMLDDGSDVWSLPAASDDLCRMVSSVAGDPDHLSARAAFPARGSLPDATGSGP